MYIYAADTYCNLCGDTICTVLNHKGKRPANIEDERSYDSDQYPKYVADCGESDSPCHCASGPECLDADTLEDWEKVGKLLGTDLNEDGYRWLDEHLPTMRPALAAFYRNQFDVKA